jgi:hypothetical protein
MTIDKIKKYAHTKGMTMTTSKSRGGISSTSTAVGGPSAGKHTTYERTVQRTTYKHY